MKLTTKVSSEKNAISVKSNQESYDVDAKQFSHDENRGKWDSIRDFYLVSIGQSFNIYTLFLTPIVWIFHGGIIGLTSFILNLMFFVIPVLFSQSVLGQFSSSGFLSVFRLTPLFKGLGYVMLVLNLLTVSYSSVLAMYPLILIFYSFSAELPWVTCNNTWNSNECYQVETLCDVTYNVDCYNTAPMEFFRRNLTRSSQGFTIPNLVFLLLIWIQVGLYNCQGVKSIQKIFRYGLPIVGVLFLTIFIRFAALPGNVITLNELYETFFSFKIDESITISPILAIGLLGSGWGNAITIASFNKFKANVTRYSQVIPFMTISVIILSTIFLVFAFGYAKNANLTLATRFDENIMSLPYYFMPFVISTLEIPQLWSIIFYSILFILQSNIVALQVFGICTALFDEFEKPRKFKKTYLFALCLILFFISYVYASGVGLGNFLTAFEWLSIGQMCIWCMHLMVIGFVYGKIRFQRDVQFLTGHRFSNFKFYVLKFITPIVLMVSSLASVIFYATCSKYIGFSYMYFTVFVVAPLMFVSIYAMCKRKPISRSDWCPSDQDDRRHYEKLIESEASDYQRVEENP